MIDRVAQTKAFWSCIQLTFCIQNVSWMQLDGYNFSQISVTHWHVANENPGYGVMAHAFMFVNNSVKEAWQTQYCQKI